MTDAATELLREHLKLCSEAYRFGLVPTQERHWVDTGDYLMLSNRWYYESDLRKRTIEFLASSLSGDERNG